MSVNTPRIGNWVTVKGHEEETYKITGIDYENASILTEHMNGEFSHHFFRNIIYIGKEYYEPKGNNSKD